MAAPTASPFFAEAPNAAAPAPPQKRKPGRPRKRPRSPDPPPPPPGPVKDEAPEGEEKKLAAELLNTAPNDTTMGKLAPAPSDSSSVTYISAGSGKKGKLQHKNPPSYELQPYHGYLDAHREEMRAELAAQAAAAGSTDPVCLQDLFAALHRKYCKLNRKERLQVRKAWLAEQVK